MENKIKKTAIFTGVLFVILLLLDLWFKISIDISNTLYLPFLSLILIIFILSTLILFIILDMKNEKFVYLKALNYIALTIGLSTFVYWGFIKPDAWGLIFTAYTVVFMICNNVLMSIIYFVKNIGKKYILMEWLVLAISICIYLLLPKLLIYFNVIKKL